VTRYVPITHHLLPAITSTGRIYESKDAWTGNPMTTSSSHTETCERPGIYTIALLDECDNHCVATDIPTDGNFYMVILEVLLPEDNETESQRTKTMPGRSVLRKALQRDSNVCATNRAPNITWGNLVQRWTGCEKLTYHQRWPMENTCGPHANANKNA
jgi:hypothetical protein